MSAAPDAAAAPPHGSPPALPATDARPAFPPVQPSALSLATQLAHFGCRVDEHGSITPAIHLSTTFERAPDMSWPAGHVYSRWSNPSRDALEAGMAALEGGAGALAYASGMAAMCGLLQALPRGHVIMPSDLYHGVRYAITGTFHAWGLTHSEVDMRDGAALEAALAAAAAAGYGTPGSAKGPLLLHLETPSNPCLLVTDVEAAAAAGHRHGALVCVDATWMTPLLCRPLGLGADVVLHSTTKYLGGACVARAWRMRQPHAGARV